MKTQSDTFLYEKELPWEVPAAGIRRQILGHDDRLMIVKVEFEQGSDGGGRHSHPHSQSCLIVSGRFDVTVDGKTQTLGAGDGFYVAPDVLHGVICLEAGTVLDAFSPMREEFLK